ncbi:MAG: tryptophan synthase subunit beta, partial [Phormidesmis sp. CAN_BIN44]|nr:tryptophan synthase subunit beta [Phormidesmis sp. CAN_BIN44]
DQQALDAFQQLSQLEGIIPALETAHAIAYLDTLCPQLTGSPRLVINCSGRGDKDVLTVSKILNP